MDTEAAQDLIATLDAATSLSNLSPLKSVELHKLTRSRKGQWALTIQGPWHLCLRFKGKNSYDVDILTITRGEIHSRPSWSNSQA